VAAVVVVLLAGAAGGWLLWSRTAAPPVVVPAPVATALPPAIAPAPEPGSPPPIVAAPPAFAVATATEQQILDHVSTDLAVFRFADNPRILVLDFASLHAQGRMLNRVAALTEKAGLPHDRVISDSELGAAISARGDTVETFYYGHDYAAASLARFYELADREHVELDRQEARLRALMAQEGWFAPGVTAGLITLPAVGSDPKMTAPARAAILRHELSHGEFFSNPVYAEYVRNFWLTALTDAERTMFRGFLAREEYDPTVEELMFNEMQAYLMFTRDPLFFTPGLAGLTKTRLEELQSRFLAGMPGGWLREVLASYPATAR
jgi:hypothetical protein